MRDRLRARVAPTPRYPQATGRAGEAVAAMADHRDYFRQVAAECRRLAEIANKPEIKQRLLNMAAEYQAKADEHSNDRRTVPELAEPVPYE